MQYSGGESQGKLTALTAVTEMEAGACNKEAVSVERISETQRKGGRSNRRRETAVISLP